MHWDELKNTMIKTINQIFILLSYFATALRNDRIIKHHKAKLDKDNEANTQSRLS